MISFLSFSLQVSILRLDVIFQLKQTLRWEEAQVMGSRTRYCGEQNRIPAEVEKRCHMDARRRQRREEACISEF
jgi:hypothetical protein